MPPCKCSACDPDGCHRLFAYLRFLKEENFDEAIRNGVPASIKVPPPLCLKRDAKNEGEVKVRQLPEHHATPMSKKDPVRRLTGLQVLAISLIQEFTNFFNTSFSVHSDLLAEDLFDEDQAWLVCKNYQHLLNGLSLDSILGSEPLSGTYNLLLSCIHRWLKSESYSDYQSAVQENERLVKATRLRGAEKETQHIAALKRREAEALAKEERALVRLEKRETKRLLAEAEKERKRVWWEGERLVLEGYKQAAYGQSHSVST